MLPLRLSQVFLATLGLGAALLSLPLPLTESNQDTLVKSIYQQPSIQQEKEDEERPSIRSAEIEHTRTLFRVNMPQRLAVTGEGALEVRAQGGLFSALVVRGISTQETTSGATQEPQVENEPEIEASSSERTPTIGSAQRIVVPSVGIDIAVQPGTYDASSGVWEVDDTSAFHADTTVPVNDTNGTTLIYGHAKWGIFGALPDVQPGAEVTVYTGEGARFIYTLESLKEVDPSDVSLFTSEGEPKLVLQTCSGFFDQYRTLAFFDLKEIVHG